MNKGNTENEGNFDHAFSGLQELLIKQQQNAVDRGRSNVSVHQITSERKNGKESQITTTWETDGADQATKIRLRTSSDVHTPNKVNRSIEIVRTPEMAVNELAKRHGDKYRSLLEEILGIKIPEDVAVEAMSVKINAQGEWYANWTPDEKSAKGQKFGGIVEFKKAVVWLAEVITSDLNQKFTKKLIHEDKA